MKKGILFAAVLCWLPGLFFVQDVSAAIYKYVDKDGIVCFADDLQAVPEKYRSQAIVVQGDARDEAAKEQAPLVIRADREQAATEPAASVRNPRPFSFRLMVSAAFAVGMTLVFMILAKQAFVAGNKKAHSFIRASFIAIVSLYILIAHASDVLTVFGMAGKAIDDAQQRSAEKGKRAAEAVKTLDALLEQAQKAQETSSSAEGGHK